MSTILTFSPDLVHDLLVAAASAAAGAVAVYWRTQQQRAANAEDKQLIAAFMGGNDEWLAGHQATFAIEAASEKHVDAEVLHVEHATGEHPVLADQPADTDEVDDEQPGESWPWRTTLALTVAVLAVAVLLPFWVLRLVGEWVVGKVQSAAAAWRRRRDERHLIGSGEQATDVDPFAALLAAEPEPVIDPVPPVNPTYKSRRCPNGTVSTGDWTYRSRHVKPGWETAEWSIVNVPAQRTGDADA